MLMSRLVHGDDDKSIHYGIFDHLSEFIIYDKYFQLDFEKKIHRFFIYFKTVITTQKTINYQYNLKEKSVAKRSAIGHLVCDVTMLKYFHYSTSSTTYMCYVVLISVLKY